MRGRTFALLGGVGAIMLAAAGVGGWQLASEHSVPAVHAAAEPPLAAQAGPLAPSPDPVLTPPDTSTAPPTRLSIPALGVDAVTEAVGVDAQGRMAVPSQPDHVAWYRLGASPGQPGDAVIDGHLDWWTGPAVFWHLSRLKIGDEISVQKADGVKVRFVVDAQTTVSFDAAPASLFTMAGPPSLSLITCAGSWDRQRQTYLTRLVVHASLVPPAPSQTPGDAG